MVQIAFIQVIQRFSKCRRVLKKNIQEWEINLPLTSLILMITYKLISFKNVFKKLTPHAYFLPSCAKFLFKITCIILRGLLNSRTKYRFFFLPESSPFLNLILLQQRIQILRSVRPYVCTQLFINLGMLALFYLFQTLLDYSFSS